RVGGSPTIRLRGPAQRLEQGRGIENISTRLVRPLLVDEPDNRDVFVGAVPSGPIVEQVHASLSRFDQKRRVAQPTADRGREFLERPGWIVVSGVSCRQTAQQLDDCGPGATLARGEWIVIVERSKPFVQQDDQALKTLSCGRRFHQALQPPNGRER